MSAERDLIETPYSSTIVHEIYLPLQSRAVQSGMAQQKSVRQAFNRAEGQMLAALKARKAEIKVRQCACAQKQSLTGL